MLLLSIILPRCILDHLKITEDTRTKDLRQPAESFVQGSSKGSAMICSEGRKDKGSLEISETEGFGGWEWGFLSPNQLGQTGQCPYLHRGKNTSWWACSRRTEIVPGKLRNAIALLQSIWLKGWIASGLLEKVANWHSEIYVLDRSLESLRSLQRRGALILKVAQQARKKNSCTNFQPWAYLLLKSVVISCPHNTWGSVANLIKLGFAMPRTTKMNRSIGNTLQQIPGTIQI